jgi:hypothetical protein
VRLLPAAFAFHALIAVVMGIVTFSVTMAGALVLLLWPLGAPLGAARRDASPATPAPAAYSEST